MMRSPRDSTDRSRPLPEALPRRLAATALVLALWGAAVLGQEPAPLPAPPVAGAANPAPRLMELADFEGLALRYNPTLAQAAAAVDMQMGVWRQAGLYPNPQLGYLRSDASQAGQSQTNGMFYTQEFVTAHKLQRARAVESREIERLRWERAAQRQRVLNDLRTRYVELLGAQEQLAIAQHLVQLAEQGTEAVARQQRNQVASRPDLLQARIQLSQLRMVLDDARARHLAAWRQLAIIVGVPNLAVSAVGGRLEEPVPEYDLDSSLQKLYAESPQLRVAEVEVQHARAEIERERAQPVPNVTLQTVAEYDRTQRYTTVTTLAALPVPVFNRNQGNIEHAYADLRESQAEVARVRLVLRDLLVESLRHYSNARYRVEQYHQHVLPSAQENLELVEAGAREGQFNLFQLLTARQTYAHAHLGYVEALTELQKSTVEIDGLQLTGGLNPATLGAAIQAGGNTRQQGLLNQVQEGASKQALPGTIQSLGP